MEMQAIPLVNFTPKRLKRLRKALGITQALMGINIGRCQSCIAKWESGENTIPSWAARDFIFTEQGVAMEKARKKKSAKKRRIKVDGNSVL